MTESALTVITGVDKARAALIQARSDFERLRVRDMARAATEAAAILKRRDIQTEASILVQEAERAIAKANPPTPPKERSPGRGGKNTVAPDDGIPASTIRDIRSTHASVDDEQFEEAIGTARANQEPMTRKTVRAAGKKPASRSDEVRDKAERAGQRARSRVAADRRETVKFWKHTADGLAATLAEAEARLAEAGIDDGYVSRDDVIAEKDKVIAEKNKLIEDHEAEIDTLHSRAVRAEQDAAYWQEYARKLEEGLQGLD